MARRGVTVSTVRYRTVRYGTAPQGAKSHTRQLRYRQATSWAHVLTGVPFRTTPNRCLGITSPDEARKNVLNGMEPIVLECGVSTEPSGRNIISAHTAEGLSGWYGRQNRPCSCRQGKSIVIIALGAGFFSTRPWGYAVRWNGLLLSGIHSLQKEPTTINMYCERRKMYCERRKMVCIRRISCPFPLYHAWKIDDQNQPPIAWAKKKNRQLVSCVHWHQSITTRHFFFHAAAH